MQKKLFVVFGLVVVLALVAACGGGEASGTGSGAAGSASNGEVLFKQALVGQNPGCATCHSVDGTQLVGPTLQGIAGRIAEGTAASTNAADVATRVRPLAVAGWREACSAGAT